MNQPVDISPHHLKIVTDALKRHLPKDTKVWVFGSRAKWTARDTSDLDLAIEGEKRMGLKVAARLSAELEDSELPYSVDVVDLLNVDEDFRKIIEKDRVLVSDLAEHQDSAKNIDCVPKGWQKRKLRDGVIKSNQRSIGRGYSHNIIKYLDTGSITEGKVSSYSLTELSQAPSRAKRLVKNNDIIYSMVRPIQRHYGFIQDPPENLVVSTGFSVIETNKEHANPLFIYYILISDRIVETLSSIAASSTSAYPSLRPNDIEDLEVLLPPISEQNKIAEILGNLDKKIELNPKINQNLENLAKAIFRSWFVDFDPVHAKKIALESGLSKGKAERAAMAVISGICAPAVFTENSKEMDKQLSEKLSQMSQREKEELAETAALFPSEFEDSELGEIPKGWAVEKLGDIVNRLKTKNKYNKKNVSYEGATVVYEQGASLVLGYIHDEPDFQCSTSKPKFIFGDHTCIMRLVAHNFSVSENVIVLEGKDYPTSWVYYSCLGKQKFEEYRRHWSEFVVKKTVLPPMRLALRFSSIQSSFQEEVEINYKETRRLEIIRDTLLSKLLSGAISLNGVSFD